MSIYGQVQSFEVTINLGEFQFKVTIKQHAFGYFKEKNIFIFTEIPDYK